MKGRYLFRGLGALILLLPWNARADESEDALAQGVALRRERRDSEALAAFNRAYELSHSPQALAQIALAEAALGKWVAAEADLTRALVSEDAWIARQRPALQVAFAEIEGHLGTLGVTSADGAEIWIDHELAGHAPVAALRVEGGHHRIELRAAGMVSVAQEVDVKPGDTVRAEFPLVLVPVVAPPATAPSAARGAGENRRRLFAWGTAGGAALFAGGGAAATAWAASSASRYNSSACDRPGEVRSVQCSSTASAVHTAEALEVVGYAGAGVAAMTSLILFAVHPHETTRSPVAFGLTLGGAWCSYRF